MWSLKTFPKAGLARMPSRVASSVGVVVGSTANCTVRSSRPPQRYPVSGTGSSAALRQAEPSQDDLGLTDLADLGTGLRQPVPTDLLGPRPARDEVVLGVEGDRDDAHPADAVDE